MPTLLPRMFFAYLAIGIGVAGFSPPARALQKEPLAQAKCECKCIKKYEGNNGEVITVTLGSKTFAAPGGDPKACGGLAGTRCRSGASGTVEGELSNCSGVVERKRRAIETAPGVEPSK